MVHIGFDVGGDCKNHENYGVAVNFALVEDLGGVQVMKNRSTKLHSMPE
jgi:hypothetical protein